MNRTIFLQYDTYIRHNNTFRFHSEYLNVGIRIECMEAYENLIKIGDWNTVSKVLGTIGYKLFPSDHDKIKKRIESIKSTAKLKDSMSMKDKRPDRPDKDYFIRERSMLTAHFKMYIDPGVYKAKKYFL